MIFKGNVDKNYRLLVNGKLVDGSDTFEPLLLKAIPIAEKMGLSDITPNGSRIVKHWVGVHQQVKITQHIL